MSKIGTVLVVLNLAMSVLFMSLAGGVFATHETWKAKHENVQKDLKSEKDRADGLQQEMDQAKQTLGTQATTEKTRGDELFQKTESLTKDLAAAEATNNSLEQKLQAATGLSEVKAREAVARQEEAEKQRAVNKKIQSSLDDANLALRQLRDTSFSKTIEYENLQKKHTNMLETLGYLKKTVERAGLETDPRIIERLQAPPPPVDGLVVDIKKDKTNRTKFIEISIGSDEGLTKGHVMDVYRTVEGADTKYLGKVMVISVEPDNAVCEVIEAEKNGIIQVGDTASTKI